MATQHVKNKATGEVTIHDEIDADILISSGRFESLDYAPIHLIDDDAEEAQSDELGD